MSDPLDDLSSLQSRCLEDLVRVTRCVRRWLEHAEGDPGDPGPDATWSVAEHALHVILSMEYAARGFADGGALVHEREPSLKRLAVLTTWRIPKGATAPPPVAPTVILPPAELRTRLDEARDALVQVVRQLRGGEPPGYLSHFALGPMTRKEWFRFLLIHAKHHDGILVARRQVRR